VIVGFHSPLPPTPTGVADYAAALTEALRGFGELKVNEPGGDVCLYHLGNNQLHAGIYHQALSRPGVIVLHDAVLHHFFLGSLDREAYIEEFVWNYGEWSRGLAGELWDERRRAAVDERYFRYAMVRRVAEVSRAVVVHNPGAARIVAAHAPGARVVEIPLLFGPHAPVSEAETLRWRGRHRIAAGTFLFGVFGHLRESKRLLPTMRAFRRVREAGVDAALLVAGEFSSPDLARAAGPLLAAPGIVRTGYLPEREFWTAAKAVDACINLRAPSAGETSAIGIRLMGIGKPVPLTAGEETARFPETACVRVESGVAEERMLAHYMMCLALEREAARAIGRRAAVHIGAHHAPAEVARRYWEVLCEHCG
jgi:glycosyltransferase involved in cell wall biosynthesis